MRRTRCLAARGGALGDFVVTLPALQAIRRSRPEAELHLLTRPACGRLAVACGLADGWRALDDPAAALLFVRGGTVSDDWRAWLAGFDVVFSWVPDPDGAFASQVILCGAREFVQGPSRVTGPGPASLCLAALPSPHTLHPESPVCLLKPFLTIPHPGHIALHPGSGSRSKNWPFRNWLAVADHLRKQNRLERLILITGEVEEEVLPQLTADLTAAGIPFDSVHAQPLEAVAERLAGCALFLGHDSGVAHLAAACGVPCRLLFGPTDPAVWAPPASWVHVLRAPGGDPGALTVREVTGWLDAGNCSESAPDRSKTARTADQRSAIDGGTHDGRHHDSAP